jgi:hypothetical protein
MHFVLGALKTRNDPNYRIQSPLLSSPLWALISAFCHVGLETESAASLGVNVPDEGVDPIFAPRSERDFRAIPCEKASRAFANTAAGPVITTTLSAIFDILILMCFRYKRTESSAFRMCLAVPADQSDTPPCRNSLVSGTSVLF